jgi:hypothetical protein
VARNVTLTTLKSRVRWRTDTENETTRFSDTNIVDAINEGLAKLHSRMVRARGESYLESTSTVSTVNGTESYALPASFLSLLKVYTTIDNREIVLTPYEFVETDGYTDTSSWSPLVDLQYRLRGANISFRPIPDAAHTVTLVYAPASVLLVSGSDTVDGVDGLEEFAVAWAAKRIATQQRDFALCNVLDGEMERGLQEIDGLCHARDAAMPPRMLDVKVLERPRRWRTRTWRW